MATFTPLAPALALYLHSQLSPPTAAWTARTTSLQLHVVRNRLNIFGTNLSQLSRSTTQSDRVPSSITASTDTALHTNAETRQLEDVVIVGGGLAGLATALALHRSGVKSIVLEQSATLRTSGTVIGIWTNAWQALDALGVSESLRKKFWRMTGFEFYAGDGKCLSNISFQDAVRDVELRPVDRKVLLEALEEPLPHGTVCYNARVIGVRKIDGAYTEVELQDGSTIQTKVLVGCDGVGSVVARWMGFKDPRYVGYVAIRGVAELPEKHDLNTTVKQIVGRGVRVGLVPVDPNRVYWFVTFKHSGVGKITDPELVREEALRYVQGWPFMIEDSIIKSPPETLSRRAISDRWMWPVVSPPFFNSGVTLAGDAMHPLTPNLAQGGCCSLEDGVILGRELSRALVGNSSIERDAVQVNGHRKETGASLEMERIDLALSSYTNERRHRILPISIKSFFIGEIFHLDSELVCSARNELLPRMIKLDGLTDHTFYDCGTL